LKRLPREEAWAIREREATAAAAELGIAALDFWHGPDWFLAEHIEETAARLREALRRDAAERVYVPHEHESHPDHRAAAAIVRAALRGVESGARPGVLMYEVWTPLAEFDEVEDITPVLRRKLRAVRCYESQLAGFRYDRAVRGLNQYRGALAAHCRYAEVFQTLDVGDGVSSPR